MISHRGLSLLTLLLLGVRADAHPTHVSMAEMEWNLANRSLEVSLKIAPEDLELALSRFVGRKTAIVRDRALDDPLRELMAARFSLTPEDGQPLALVWVGYEVSPRAAYLYFEFRISPGENAFRLSNRLLLEARPRQVNTVIVKLGARRQTFRFHRDALEAILQLPPGERHE